MCVESERWKNTIRVSSWAATKSEFILIWSFLLGDELGGEEEWERADDRPTIIIIANNNRNILITLRLNEDFGWFSRMFRVGTRPLSLERAVKVRRVDNKRSLILSDMLEHLRCLRFSHTWCTKDSIYTVNINFNRFSCKFSLVHFPPPTRCVWDTCSKLEKDEDNTRRKGGKMVKFTF